MHVLEFKLKIYDEYILPTIFKTTNFLKGTYGVIDNRHAFPINFETQE